MVEPTKCEEAPRVGTFRALRGMDPSVRANVCDTDSMIPVSRKFQFTWLFFGRVEGTEVEVASQA